MLNCNAVTAETSANLMGSFEVGLIHQKHLQLKHGLVIGFRLDLGKGCNLKKDSALWPSAIPKEALNNKELSGPPGTRVFISVGMCSAPPLDLHTWTQVKGGKGTLGDQLLVNCSNGGECKLRKIQSKNDSQPYSPPTSESNVQSHQQRQRTHICTHSCPFWSSLLGKTIRRIEIPDK